MRCHVPFPCRNRPPGPVYIGFDQPVSIQRRKGRFNWAGFSGLMLALLSPLTLFLLAPLALLFSLAGLRRRPRGMAVIGLILSLGASTILSLGILGVIHGRSEARQRHVARIAAVRNLPLVEQTRETLRSAHDEIRKYRDSNANYLPDLQAGMMITVQHQDAWNRELFYEPTREGCVIRSAGPDGKFKTRDDVIEKLDGDVDDGPIERE